MKHRIEYLIEELQMTNAKFAEEINVPKSIISHILTGRNKPSLEFITKILTKFKNINPEWLLFGKGNIYKTLSQEDSSNNNNNNTENATLFDNINKNLPDNDKNNIPLTNNSNNRHSDIITENKNKHIITKQIKKIIVYYSDNTFEEFNK